MIEQYRQRIGKIGERVVADELLSRCWLVKNLNQEQTNFPNCDLEIQKSGIKKLVQVKVCREFGWISAGGVNPKVCAGGPIFNRIEGAPKADFILCLTPVRKIMSGSIPEKWRFFVLPVSVAENAFRININAYFNGTKKDGSHRSKRGACQDFVGPGPFTHRTVPDHHEDFVPYENRFDLLKKV